MARRNLDVRDMGCAAWDRACHTPVVETFRSPASGGGGMAEKVRGWQDDVAAQARSAGLDVLRLDLDDTKSDIALTEFAGERRLRKG